MQTASQCKYVQKPYMSSTLVRREPQPLLTGEQNIDYDLMGLSCLVSDYSLEDYA